MADYTPQIEDYDPRYSIIITPTKMVRYYENIKLTNESQSRSSIFPMPIKVSCRWHDALSIFNEHSSVSRMYRNLGCQHHLIQEPDDQRPNIPGLTPLGFERWVTLLIRAHPGDEYRRLQKPFLTCQSAIQTIE